MQTTIKIKVNIETWSNAVKYLKDPSAGLDVDDMSAIEQLADFWRTKPFSKDLSDECAELIGVLKTNEKRYSSNNKKTKEQLSAFAGVAKIVYCTDETTYKQYVDALKEKYIVRKTPVQKPPVQKPPSPTPAPKKTPVSPSQPPQPVKSVLKILSVDFADSNDPSNKFGLTLPTTVHYLTPRIRYSIEPAPKSPVEISYRIFSPKGEMEKNDKHPDGFLSSLKLTSREGVAEFNGWGNADGVAYYEGRWRFELYSDSKLIHTAYFDIKSPFSHTPPSIDIQRVDFANTDYDGGIVNDFGTKLPQNIRYLKPRIHYTVRNKENRDIDIRYIIYRPDGTPSTNSERSDRYTASTTINLSWDSPSKLTGFGNREGNSYPAGRYRIEIYENDYLLHTTGIDIGNPTTQPYIHTPPTPPTPPPPSGSKGGSKSRSGCLVWLIIIAAAVFGWFKWCGRDDGNAKGSADDRYVVAERVFLRSSPSAANNSNIITKFPYGTQLHLIGESNGWIEVKEPQSGKKGYVAGNYVMDRNDFNHLDSIWGSRDIIDEINITRYRRALVNLYHELQQQTGHSYFLLKGPAENWMEKNIQDDANYFPEFAVIVKDVVAGQRIAAIYGFASDETPILRHLEEAPDNGGIKDISKTRSGYSVSYGDRKSQPKKTRKKQSATTPAETVETQPTSETTAYEEYR